MCAHEVRAWESEVAEEIFADAEDDGYEVVVEFGGSGIPIRSLVEKRNNRARRNAHHRLPQSVIHQRTDQMSSHPFQRPGNRPQ